MSALDAGRLMIALAFPLLFVPFIAGVLARWFTAGALSAAGLFVTAAGLFWLAWSIGSDASLVAPMVVIGIGIGLPWGLMDGLAVSVVEKERAGMATGIFNAVRVSADGVAIAVVGALLAGLIQSGLGSALQDLGPEARQGVTEASNRVALGDLGSAARLLPWAGHDLLVTVYDRSFQTQLYVLAAATALTAAVIFVLLGRVRTHEDA